ncbi:hypothetical protein [Massilia sp. S19_KUP03_FR1]|uniref:hypothetical protein n=1 Tax=Massilia sp. S19_KUP03_FR1 TaxID=3025503 RepID=UPI002FCDD4A5
MTGSRTMRVVTGSLCLLAAALAHQWLEATMLRHMLLQLPCSAAAGWLLSGNPRWRQRAAAFDRHGLSVFTAALFVSAYWMIPRALERSTTDALAETLKFGTLFALGAALPGAMARANGIIQIFFIGNFCAMTAVVGMLYQDQSTQLCNAYLVDDQAATGIGLVLASGALAIWCCLRLAMSRSAHGCDARSPPAP